jgi:hypothetical protein
MNSKGDIHKKIKLVQDEEDDLSQQQWEELEAAIQQVEDGETISWEDFLDSIKQWRAK